MAMFLRGLFLLQCFLFYTSFTYVRGYKVPQVNVQLLNKGFQVWIPDEIGVQNVAFNVNRNRPFKSFEAGEYAAQLHEPVGNRWVFESKRPVQDDDVLYIWTYVQYNRTRYQDVSSPIVVRALRDAADSSAQLATTSSSTTPTTYVTPPVTTSSSIGDNMSNVPGACVPSISISQGRSNFCRGDRIFDESFDGELDTNRWRSEVRLPLDIGDAEFVLYDTNALTEGGALSIEPFPWNNDQPGTNIRRGYLNLGSRCTATMDRKLECERQPAGQIVLPPVLSARINTKHSFSFKYGRVEIRAKLPKGDWLFPLLLLEPLQNYYGQQPYISGQMRVAFARGNADLRTRDGKRGDGHTLYGGAVLSSDAEEREKYLVKTTGPVHFGHDFHLYTLNWDKDGLTLAVDGQEYGQIKGVFAHRSAEYTTAWENGDNMAPLDKEFYITLGVAAGGHSDFSDEYTPKPWINTSPKAALYFWRDRANWKQTWTSPKLQVDYVRVYAV